MSTTPENYMIVLEAASGRLKAAEAALNLIDVPRPEGLLGVPMRRNLLAAARTDVRLIKQMLVVHKMHLGPDSHQALLDQTKALEERVYNTNIHPGLAPIPQES